MRSAPDPISSPGGQCREAGARRRALPGTLRSVSRGIRRGLKAPALNNQELLAAATNGYLLAPSRSPSQHANALVGTGSPQHRQLTPVSEKISWLSSVHGRPSSYEAMLCTSCPYMQNCTRRDGKRLWKSCVPLMTWQVSEGMCEIERRVEGDEIEYYAEISSFLLFGEFQVLHF